MNEKEKSQLEEDIEFLKRTSNALTDTKKDAQHLRGALDRVIKAGKDAKYSEENYDKLLGAFCNFGAALKSLSEVFNLEVISTSKPGTDEPIQYFIRYKDGDKINTVPLTEEQYINIGSLAYVKKPKDFKKD